MELFGPDFEQYEEVQAELDRIAIAEADREAEANAINSASYSVAVDKSKAKKGRIVAKSTGFKYQFQTMESIGVPCSEIRRFADPLYWVTYFLPLAMVSFLIYYAKSSMLSWLLVFKGR